MSVTLGAVGVRIIGAAGTALLGGTKLGALAKRAFDKLTDVEKDTRIIHHKKRARPGAWSGWRLAWKPSKAMWSW